MLPDSNKSEMMSHGFVKFSIRPKANITTKDLITNTAGIYFDFNDAVITNEVVLNKKTSKTQDFALSDIDFSLFQILQTKVYKSKYQFWKQHFQVFSFIA